MQTSTLLLILALIPVFFAVVAYTPMIYADSPFKDNPSDDDNGSGNDPNGHAPGQTNNPNPSK